MVPYLHLFSAVCGAENAMCEKLALYLMHIYCIIIFFNYAWTASSNGAICDKFSEQYQDQNNKKEPYLMPNLAFSWCK